MSYSVSTKTLDKITLNEADPAYSILQNVAIILATRKGSVPGYRNFGLSQEFVDKPINVAKTLLVAEIHEAIAEFEPRATIVNITFESDEKAPGKLIPILEVSVNAES
jgi:phage baseplate assembly protein W